MKNLLTWLKEQLKQYPIQVVGSACMLPAFILMIMAAYMYKVSGYLSYLICYVAWLTYAAVGVVDLYLLWKAKIDGVKAVTITKWWRALLPKYLDNIVMIGFIVLVWVLVGPLFALFYLAGFLNNHLNEAR